MSISLSKLSASSLRSLAVCVSGLIVGGCGGAQARTVPADLVLTGSGATPTVAVSPNGNVSYVAWVETSLNRSDVHLARIRGDGTLIGEPVRVNDQPGDADPHEQAPPQVRLGSDGEVYILWQKKVAVDWLPFGASELRFSRSLDGAQTFSPAATIAADDGPPARRTFHDLAVAPDGSIYVSWIDAGRRDAARSAHAHAAGSHVTHRHGTQEDEPGTEIRVVRSTDGGLTFGPAAVIDDRGCPCCRTSLAVASDGSVYVAYRKIFDGDVRDIAIARSTDQGRTFSEARPVHSDGWVFPGCPHAGPSIAVDESGTVHAAWYTGKEGAQGILYASSIDGAVSFSTPLRIEGGEWMPPSTVRLAVEGTQVWVTWDDRRFEEAIRPVQLARIRGQRLDVSEPGGDGLTGTTPDLALANGARTLVWKDGDAVHARVYGGTP